MPQSHSYSVKKHRVTLKGRIKIDFNAPLPFYNQGPLLAYNATLLQKADDPIYVLVCDKALMPRLTQAGKYSQMKSPSTAALIENGVALNPLTGQEVFVFVYRMIPDLQRLWDSDKDVAMNMDQKTLLNHIVPLFLDMLRFLDRHNFAHGGIRLTNIFVQKDKKHFSHFALGDCVALPYSYAQPTIYLPPQIGFCDPFARGIGHISHDIYAVGVCLALMVRRKNPLEGLTEEEIYRRKQKDGSYTAILGEDRLSGPLAALIRGMLHDDPQKRVKVEELKGWESGQHYTPKQNPRPKSAVRPISFAGTDYLRSDILSMDLPHNTAELAHFIENQELLQWLERAVNDKRQLERFDRALTLSSKMGRTEDKEDILATNIALAMNPDLPVIYKGRKFLPDQQSMASLIAHDMAEDFKLNELANVLKNGLILNWLAVQFDTYLDVPQLTSIYELARTYVRNPKTGYGLERCLYLLHPYTPCLSPVFKNHYIFDSKDLLYRLDNLLEEKKKTPLFDRHMVAFLSERDSRIMQNSLYDLNSTMKHKAEVSILKCYGLIQKNQKLEPLPHLAQAFAPYFDTICGIFHNRDTRKKVKKDLENFAEKGDLASISRLLEGGDRLQHDQYMFRLAQNDYFRLEQEKNEIKIKLSSGQQEQLRESKALSTFILSVLGGVLILLIVIGYLGGHVSF